MICSEIWSVQKEKFRLKWNNEQYIQISIFTGKRLWWRPFTYSCGFGGLQPYEKVTPSEKNSCETCEILQNIIFKENCWVTAFSNILDVSLVLSTINQLIIWEFQKQLFTSDSESFAFNQNTTNVESNILLMRSTEQRKWYIAEAVTIQTWFTKGVLKYWANSQENIFARVFFLGCRSVMNNCFFVNGFKHLRTSASDLGKYLTALTIIFDSVENIWNFGLWSNLATKDVQ